MRLRSQSTVTMNQLHWLIMTFMAEGKEGRASSLFTHKNNNEKMKHSKRLS